jgi:hypothetical protein
LPPPSPPPRTSKTNAETSQASGRCKKRPPELIIYSRQNFTSWIPPEQPAAPSPPVSPGWPSPPEPLSPSWLEAESSQLINSCSNQIIDEETEKDSRSCQWDCSDDEQLVSNETSSCQVDNKHQQLITSCGSQEEDKLLMDEGNDIPLDVAQLSESSNVVPPDNNGKNASSTSQSLRYKLQTTSVSDSIMSGKLCQEPPATLPKPTWTTNQIIKVKGRAANATSAIARHSVTATDQVKKGSSSSVTSTDSPLVIETTESSKLSPSTSKKAIGYPSSPPVPKKTLFSQQSPPPANKQLDVTTFQSTLKKAASPLLLASTEKTLVTKPSSPSAKEALLAHPLSPPIALKPLKTMLSPQLANRPAIARIPLGQERTSKPTAVISPSVAMLASLYEADKQKGVSNSKTKKSKDSRWIDIQSKCNIEQVYFQDDLELTDNCELNISSKTDLEAPKVDHKSHPDVPSATENESHVTNSIVISCGPVGKTSSTELPISSTIPSKAPAFKTVRKSPKAPLMCKSPPEDRSQNKITSNGKPRTQPKPLSADILKRFEGDIKIQQQHSQTIAKPASKPFEKRFTFNNFDTLPVNPNSPGYLRPASPTSPSSFSFPTPSSLLTFLTLPRPSYKQPPSRSETIEVSQFLFLI